MAETHTKSIDCDVIQTLRTAHQNQTQLNLMADQKANILIGTLVLMYTVVFTRILTLAEYSDQVMVPLASFIVLGIIPLVLTTMVLIPRNIKGKNDITVDGMPNPLFFGFFTKFTEKEYCQYMAKSLSDNKSARNLLVKDLYQIGVILKRKYNLLRMAYIFAMIGLVIPLLLWVIIYMENT